VEPTGIPGRLSHIDRNAFARHVLGDDGSRCSAHKSNGSQTGESFLETEHDVFVSFGFGFNRRIIPPCEVQKSPDDRSGGA
jgi:hypothetical protein